MRSPRLRRSLLLATFAAACVALPPSQAVVPAGSCFGLGGDPGRQRLFVVPLESTEIALTITPGLVEAEVMQTFTNRTGVALEATYEYPLPDGAAVTDFELRYPGRVVRSTVKPKAEARAVYEAAKNDGRKAALLEQRDPTLFSTAVANFLPGETVHLVLRFVQQVDIRESTVNLRFPMVTPEKYFPESAAPDTPGNAATNPLRRPRGTIVANHVYAFSIEIAGLPATAITSPSHRIRIVPPAKPDGPTFVSLADEITIPDRDFVLHLERQPTTELASTVVTQHRPSGEYGVLTVFPPAESRPRDTLMAKPRDVLFLLDRSGSMEGMRLESAKLGLKRCLAMLSPGDRFQVVLFSSSFEFYAGHWIPADPQAIADAQQFVRDVRVDGGTELQPALAASLDAFERNRRQKVLILLTDGDVGNEATLLNLVETKVGDVRLFTFGIGDEPNAALLRKVAETGHGEARFIAHDDAVERELGSLFTSLSSPVLQDLAVTFCDTAGRALEAVCFPQAHRDVFAGGPIQTSFRISHGTPSYVDIAGKTEAGAVRFRVPVVVTTLAGDALEKHFGRQLYEDTALMYRRAKTAGERELIDRELLDTALQFQLVTDRTSRVAVEQRISRSADTPLVTQPVGQYQESDHGGADGETVVLSPFCVSTDGDRGYATASTYTGTRHDSSDPCGFGVIHIVTHDLFEDAATRSTEALRPYAMSPLAGVAVPSGHAVASVNGLPIATIVDPATINDIAFRTLGTASSDVAQYGPATRTAAAITSRIGTDGFANVAIKASGTLPAGKVPAAAIFSTTHERNWQSSGFVAANHGLGDGEVGVTAQHRSLQGYGEISLATATLRQPVTAALVAQATVAWHRLDRTDPRQFVTGAREPAYEGLGLFNLDLLTAAMSRLEDRVAQLRLDGRAGRSVTHEWSARGEWHQRSSNWLTPFNGTAEASRRTAWDGDISYRLGLTGAKFALLTELGHTRYESTHETIATRRANRAAAGIEWQPNDTVRIFGHLTGQDLLPSTLTGVWRQLDPAELAAVSAAMERRSGGRAGARINLADERLTFETDVFHERVQNLTYRDWTLERAGSPAGTLAGPIRTSVSAPFTREGCIGLVDYTPTRQFTLTGSWYYDWKHGAVFAGAARQASVWSRYDFSPRRRHGWFIGTGVSYRNDIVYSDGYRLPGGIHLDAMCGFALRRLHRKETVLQLNIRDLTGTRSQATRFQPEHGRDVVFSIRHDL